MSSFLLTYREWLYVAALVWNLAMIACFFWMSARGDTARTQLLERLKARIPGLRLLLSTAPRDRQAASIPDHRDLEELIHFSRNPRAFNYTLQGLDAESGSLLEEIQKRLAQSAAEVPDNATATVNRPPSPADAAAVEKELLEEEQQVARQLHDVRGRRILALGTLVNWIILALIAVGYFLRH